MTNKRKFRTAGVSPDPVTAHSFKHAKLEKTAEEKAIQKAKNDAEAAERVQKVMGDHRSAGLISRIIDSNTTMRGRPLRSAALDEIARDYPGTTLDAEPCVSGNSPFWFIYNRVRAWAVYFDRNGALRRSAPVAITGMCSPQEALGRLMGEMRQVNTFPTNTRQI